MTVECVTGKLCSFFFYNSASTKNPLAAKTVTERVMQDEKDKKVTM